MVLDAEEPAPLLCPLESAFEQQSVTVTTDAPGDVLIDRNTPQVALVTDGELVATSPLDALLDAYLLVNSDSYRTGTAGVDDQPAPEVLTALAGTRFHLHGFPASNKGKLLLIVLSRYVERRALAADGGILRSSFQRLSRVNDERDTRKVYERLGASNVDTHVYGVPDGVTVHGGTTPTHRRAWFVVFTPDGDGEPAAMVSIKTETDRNVWNGSWTFDPDRVAAVEASLTPL